MLSLLACLGSLIGGGESISQSAKHAFFGSLNAAGMNIERSPVIDDIILCRRHRNHAHFRILVKQSVTDQRPFAWVVESDHHEIRQSSFHALKKFRFILYFGDNFNVGLVGKSGENGFSHKARTIRHEDPDEFFHVALPCVASMGVAVACTQEST